MPRGHGRHLRGSAPPAVHVDLRPAPQRAAVARPRLPGLRTASSLIRVASFGELGPSDLYAILHVRSDVFIVEQACAYDDIDGRDTEPGTTHLWIQHDGAVR